MIKQKVKDEMGTTLELCIFLDLKAGKGTV